MAATKLVRMTVAGVGVLSASVAMDIGSASAQLEVPRVETPQVQLPAAPVSPPALPSPPPVPQVELPAPSAPVPDLQAPNVQVPDVPVPGAPPAPGVTAPGEAAPGSGGTASTQGSSSDGAPGSATAPGRSSRGARGGSAGGLTEARGAARQPASPPITSRSERGLRREVRRLSGCAGTLGGIERRVLDLRAGLDGAHPSPRRTVARTLDVPLARVRRAERDGLATLRRTNRASGCATGGDATLSISWMSLMASAGVAPELTSMASLEDGGDGGAAVASAAGEDRVKVRGDSASSVEGAAPVRPGDHGGDPTVPPTAAASLGGDGSGAPLLTWLALAALLLAVAVMSPTLLRRRRVGAAGPADQGATEAPGQAWGATPPPAREPSHAKTVPTEPTAAAPPVAARAAEPPVADAPVSAHPTGGHHASGRAVGMAVSSAMSLAVGVAMWARRRSGNRRRR